MSQSDLFRPKRLQYVDEIANIYSNARGQTKAELFEDENGKRYVAKSNKADHPFVLANEFVTHQLAQIVGLNVPTGGLRDVRGDTKFFSEYLEGSRRLVELGKDDLKSKLTRWEDLLKILCFDIWVMNHDRHFGNLLVKKNGKAHDLYLIDHDHTLLGKCQDCKRLESIHSCNAALFVNQFYYPFLDQIVDSFLLFNESIQSIQRVKDNAIASILGQVPVGLLPNNFRQRIDEVLRERKNSLPKYIVQIFQAGKFPKTTIMPAN